MNDDKDTDFEPIADVHRTTNHRHARLRHPTVPGRLVGHNATKGRHAGPVNCIRSFGKPMGALPALDGLVVLEKDNLLDCHLLSGSAKTLTMPSSDFTTAIASVRPKT
jgi:hypothetical protein